MNFYRTKGVLFQDPPEPWRARARRAGLKWLSRGGDNAWWACRFLLAFPVVVAARIVVTVVKLAINACLLPFFLVYAGVTGARIQLVIGPAR